MLRYEHMIYCLVNNSWFSLARRNIPLEILYRSHQKRNSHSTSRGIFFWENDLLTKDSVTRGFCKQVVWYDHELPYLWRKNCKSRCLCHKWRENIVQCLLSKMCVVRVGVGGGWWYILNQLPRCNGDGHHAKTRRNTLHVTLHSWSSGGSLAKIS